MKADSSCITAQFLSTITSFWRWAHAAAMLGVPQVGAPGATLKAWEEGRSFSFLPCMPLWTPGGFQTHPPLPAHWSRTPLVLAQKELLAILNLHLSCGFSRLGSGTLSCGTGPSLFLRAWIRPHCCSKTVSQGVHKQIFAAESACLVLFPEDLPFPAIWDVEGPRSLFCLLIQVT